MTIKHTPGPWKWKWGEGEVSGIPRLYAGKEIIMEGSLNGFLMGEPRIVLNGDHAKGNAKLISQAAVSPHECDDPECPGNKNRLKLEAAEISWYEGFKAGYTQARAEEVK